MNPPPYLPELKRVFNDTEYKKQRARVLLQRKFSLCEKGLYFKTQSYSQYGSYTCCWIDCCFGSFYETWDKFYERTFPLSKMRHPNIRIKNGVEVVGLKPLGTGHTFSNKCPLTIPELKERCKINGIKVKSTWKKQELLHALMKV